MYTVTWYEKNIKQTKTFASEKAAKEHAKQLRQYSDKLERTSVVPIVVRMVQ